jgi:cold shock CspA family protein/ribosome-associated translation inhibitor RaiA
MNVPVQITYRNVPANPVVEKWIKEQAQKLEGFYQPIIALRTALEMPHRHRAKGSSYHVRIDLRVPGAELLVNRRSNARNQARQAGKAEVTKSLQLATGLAGLRSAIDDAFHVAARRLQDYARRQSGRVKTHETPSGALVTTLLPEKGYGFITTQDGREIYFHKQSVLNQGFGRLRIGTPVRFVEEQGEKGPQASTVRIVRKPGPGHRLAEAPVAAS